MGNSNSKAASTTSNKDAGVEKLSRRWLEDDPSGDGTRRDGLLRTLQNSCAKLQRDRPKELDMRGVDLSGEDLSGLDFSRYDLTRVNLTGADLSNSNLSWCNLEDSIIYKAKLEGCEFLGSKLNRANLNECTAARAGLGAADLSDATLIATQLEEATLTEAKLVRADFRASNLTGASIRRADLSGANFTRATLRDVDLKRSDVNGADFHVADLRNARLLGLVNFDKATWIGADIREIDMRGAYLVRRFIMDENYLFEFKTRNKFHYFIYIVWWLTSDCGRSLFRWTLFIWLVTLFFGFFYSLTEVDYGQYETPFSPIYFSIVTLTTLGYGDALPASLAAQLLSTFQAILGYIGLGGLLSILANKIARRAD